MPRFSTSWFRFNPRSRAGSDVSASDDLEDSGVSIHAPVRGATIPARPASQPKEVSIHAPVRGATKPQVMVFWGKKFQSTLPCGERLPL